MPIIAPVEDGKLNYKYTDNSNKNGINPTGSTLGYDQFLQLLCAEMQYQDPLEPTSNTDYVAQMATFSQLEATLSMSATEENTMASNLVGKQVILKSTNANGQTSYIDGRVDYVLYENGEILLSVNDGLYPLSSLDTVADSEYYEGVTLASTFKNMVESLPMKDNLTIAYKPALEQIRELYNGMTSYQQQFVSDDSLKVLRDYEDQMQILIKQDAGTTDGEKKEPEVV